MVNQQLRLDRVSEVRRMFRSGEATRIRIAAHISQAELARAVGAKPASVSLWESGDRVPRADIALRCWAAFAQMNTPGSPS